MALTAGTRLGPYEIVAPIGAGGMGEVYRARDPRMGRDVAIKISAERFSDRFSREVHAVAALNHPNICHLYDVGPDYLVMELVEGPTLAERIRRGAIPLEEALAIAKQIAEALEAAHEKGIVHRDLKPGNIKLRPDGTVKVLDFGLAKVAAASEGESKGENSPTISMGMTQAGMILGTAAYMPPEQARGKPVDKRADIWAFGVVLYEMLTGERLFEGETVSDTLIEVATKEPHWERIPANVQRLLRRCLEKDPKRRLRDIGDAWELLDVGQGHALPSQATSHAASLRHPRLAWAVAAVVTLGFATLAFIHFREPKEESRTIKLSVPLPENNALAGLSMVSPDGRHVAFTTFGAASKIRSIWVRDLDSLSARPLSGTESGRPFSWSPDSRVLAFVTQDQKKLKKFDLASGSVLTVFDAQDSRIVGLGSWGANGVIVFELGFQGDKGLLRIPDTGGTPTLVTAINTAAGEILHTFPWFLPDGRHFLYTVANKDPKKDAVYVGDVDSKPAAQNSRMVIPAPSNAVYAPLRSAKQGYLLFVRDQSLLAQPFDADTARTTGDAVLVAEQINIVFFMGTVQSFDFSVSQNPGPYSVLAYNSGTAVGRDDQLVWLDRSRKKVGGPITLSTGENNYVGLLAISPDGNTVAFVRGDQTGSDIWLHDVARGSNSRFTFDSKSTSPVWSPDGRQIAFSSARDGNPSVHQKAANGVTPEQLLDKDGGYPRDWSRDGRYIIEGRTDPKTRDDVWVLPVTVDKSADKGGDGKPFPYLNSEFNEHAPKLSPNGQLLAYTSDANKRNEVYVETFPKREGKWQVSTNGGDYPVWSRDGKELYFEESTTDRKMMAVEVKAGSVNGSPFGAPKPLFDLNFLGSEFDVDKGGRFLIESFIGNPEQLPAVPPMTVAINWAAGLKK